MDSTNGFAGSVAQVGCHIKARRTARKLSPNESNLRRVLSAKILIDTFEDRYHQA